MRFAVSRYSSLVAGLLFSAVLWAQSPVPVGAGSYASYVPLSKSRTATRGGCQAYQTEHCRLSLPDSLSARLGTPDGSRQGSMALPTNDWWTYALVNDKTGKIWMYPGWVEATQNGIDIGYPDHWEPTGCEVKWDTPLHISLAATHSTQLHPKTECVVDGWSDFMMSFLVRSDEDYVRVTCMHGSPLVWLESDGMSLTVSTPDTSKYWVQQTEGQGKSWTVIGLKTEGLTDFTPYASRVPRSTRFSYAYDPAQSSLSTTFTVTTEDIRTGTRSHTAPCAIAFLPHHYYSEEGFGTPVHPLAQPAYMSPRGEMRVYESNAVTFTYPVRPFLPFFPAPLAWKEDYSPSRMAELNADYAKRGTFGGDTYWGGKGLTQMVHYMTFALQTGDTATFRMAKQRLKEVLIDWYTYTPGEERFYFARYPRWGALIGMDPSYDSDTFNDHHFHYGYFVYASAILCLLDDDFRTQYGAMAREVARDYANWERSSDEPWFRTLDPYCGHSFAGGLGNGGNGNGQESSSEAIQGWGGVWLLGAALQDEAMLEAGIMGYTLETRATSEYWFDRKRRNIDYTKYTHPYCCNLTMQGVGWWTWFSGDPVWMHSIQWLPISPILTNIFSEDLPFARWDYTQMYAAKEVGGYEAAEGGLGDESGLGNVCLSYLSLFDADSAARVWNRMDQTGKALAKNPDTGGITYWLIHSHKGLGEKRYDIYANHPMACAYTDTLSGTTTYAVYNAGTAPVSVHFSGAADTTITAPHGLTLTNGAQTRTVTTIEDEEEETDTDPLAWDLPYPNLALHKPVTASSEENAGCLAAHLTDGLTNTRWGSAHRDNEYAVVDLQQVCYIDYMVLRWEAAYASEYELAFSDDNISWQTATYSSAGGTERINTRLRTRYIRLTGLQRATQYGTSLYELEAYGRPLTGDANSVFAIALSASDTVLYQGQSTTLTTTAYNYNGDVLSTASEQLSYPEYGLFTETRTIDNCSASLTIVVMETEQTGSVAVIPAEVTLPVGDTQVFEIYPMNQFGIASDTCRMEFRATHTGDTTVTFDCFGQTATATAHVLPYSEVNLALGKTVTASGYENAGTTPESAVDGNMESRWSSRHQDGEWIEVDLEHSYLLDSVRIYWEAAYATEYAILLSRDGSSYETVHSETHGNGGTDVIRDMAPASADQEQDHLCARYVRIECYKRNTNYGSSIWELQVFGSGRCGNYDTGIQETADESPDKQTFKYLKDGKLYISRGGIVYTVGGLVFMREEKR